MIEAFEDYATEHAIHTAAPDRISYAIEALLKYWADSMVGDVTSETCRAYAEFRKVSDGTVRRELGVLRAAINHEHKRGRITRPVFVSLPPKPDHRDRWLTRGEAAALLNASRHDARCRLYLPLFILIGLYTGARKGAILTLRWPQVDLERGRIDFNPPGRRRTSKGRPIIPIPRGLHWFLRKARARGAELGYVINRDGQPVGDIKRAFTTACQRAGLNDVTPHTLRHTAGTWMAQRGTPLWEVAGYLGHSHERTTELYSHHHPDFLSKAREALD
ncbi:MAG: site-specific integrase [Alphaproteobacteria bacterium]|nr:site-specific integrase [Alphaproteobacteria bacterium]